MAITGSLSDGGTAVEANLREKFDYAGAVSDLKRAAQAGGPRQYARWWGRPRGADRFPPRNRARNKR